MSYCVNCGVELEQSLTQCPLCNTPVWHPDGIERDQEQSPYPSQKADVSRAKRTDAGILLSVFTASTAVGCGLLNLLVFQMNAWSLYIIGACVLLWLFFAPQMFYQKMPRIMSVLFDGCAVGIYVAIIAFQFHGWEWYKIIALPIVAMGTVLIMIFLEIIIRTVPSILFMATAAVLEIGVFCVGVNMSISYFLHQTFSISWGAIVMTCCIIMALSFAAIMRTTHVRNELRKRMHI